MATRMMTRACAESSRQPHAADASIDVCTGPHDDGEDHGPRDARLAFLAGVAAALLAPAARVLVGRGVRSFADPQAPGRLAHRVARAVAQAVLNSANPQSPIAGTGGPPGNTEFALPDGTTVKRDGGGNIPDELVGELSNEVGTISMANTGAPNSGGSQFFLNTKHNAFLDYFDNSTPSKHPVFGKVVDGMDVVTAIEGVPTDGRDKPIDAVRVESITIAE